MRELSAHTKNLIEKYKFWQQSLQPKQGVNTIHIDEVALQVAAFYEQIRTIVDWKEEHLMRRAAVIRKLKRRFLDFELNNFTEIEDVGESLVLELIRGGHFPNDKIEDSKISDVQNIINKYIFILKNSSENKKGGVPSGSGLQFYNWLLELCSCEIEETLAPAVKEMALIDYMFELMKEKIKINEGIYELGLLKKPASPPASPNRGESQGGEDKDIQIYIAVQQALFKFDRPMISYNLIKYKYPNWDKADKDLLFKISQNICKIWNKIEQDLACPVAKKFYTICEKYDTPYLLLGDILTQKNSETAEKEIKEPSALEQSIKSAYKKRLASLKARISRAAIYSTVSIFLTKIITLVILEIFLTELLTGRFNAITLIFDILIPTALMFGLVTAVKLPSEKNLSMVILETMKIVYKNEKTDIYEVKIHKKRGAATKALISFVYVLSAFFSFGLIYLIFKFFNFPITSIVINIIFIALILFAGTAVRKRAEELTIEDEREGFLSFMSDVFFLPIAGMGRWMSNKWKKYNAIAAFFNALIDMPFSVFVEFIERWRYFIKERKEEIR